MKTFLNEAVYKISYKTGLFSYGMSLSSMSVPSSSSSPMDTPVRRSGEHSEFPGERDLYWDTIYLVYIKTNYLAVYISRVSWLGPTLCRDLKEYSPPRVLPKRAAASSSE